MLIVTVYLFTHLQMSSVIILWNLFAVSFRLITRSKLPQFLK
jgi:hypothetical protein